MHHFNFRSAARLSQLFAPDALSSNSSLKSTALAHMLQHGFVTHARGRGLLSSLPLLQRSIDKLIHIIDQHMIDIGGQRMQLPTLIHRSLWETSGRLTEESQRDLLTTKDFDNHEYLLGPTHEEAFTALVRDHWNNRITPQRSLRLYQISSKFRNELNPRFGLLRSREFMMKDLYSFDAGSDSCHDTYNSVRQAYRNIIRDIDLPIYEVEGAVGSIGGSMSHEFHLPLHTGQDSINFCLSCSGGSSADLDADLTGCPVCGDDLDRLKTVEIAHCFLLADRYSKPFLLRDSAQECVQMGSYGIGIGRLLAAAMEFHSSEETIVWPKRIAPYSACVILPPRFASASHASLCESALAVSCEQFPHDVIVDDRPKHSLGFRLRHAKALGWPVVIVCGSCLDAPIPQFEVYEADRSEAKFLTHSQLVYFLTETSHEKCR